MTESQLLWRINRVKGLTLVDVWGTRARVDRLDGAHVWLWYEGLDVPFRRTLASLVLAANGHFESDRSRQFTKRLLGPSGMPVTLWYEPNWVSSGGSSVTAPRPTLESLQARHPFQRKRR